MGRAIFYGSPQLAPSEVDECNLPDFLVADYAISLCWWQWNPAVSRWPGLL